MAKQIKLNPAALKKIRTVTEELVPLLIMSVWISWSRWCLVRSSG